MTDERAIEIISNPNRAFESDPILLSALCDTLALPYPDNIHKYVTLKDTGDAVVVKSLFAVYQLPYQELARLAASDGDVRVLEYLISANLVKMEDLRAHFSDLATLLLLERYGYVISRDDLTFALIYSNDKMVEYILAKLDSGDIDESMLSTVIRRANNTQLFFKVVSRMVATKIEELDHRITVAQMKILVGLGFILPFRNMLNEFTRIQYSDKYRYALTTGAFPDTETLRSALSYGNSPLAYEMVASYRIWKIDYEIIRDSVVSGNESLVKALYPLLPRGFDDGSDELTTVAACNIGMLNTLYSLGEEISWRTLKAAINARCLETVDWLLEYYPSVADLPYGESLGRLNYDVEAIFEKYGL